MDRSTEPAVAIRNRFDLKLTIDGSSAKQIWLRLRFLISYFFSGLAPNSLAYAYCLLLSHRHTPVRDIILGCSFSRSPYLSVRSKIIMIPHVRGKEAMNIFFKLTVRTQRLLAQRSVQGGIHCFILQIEHSISMQQPSLLREPT